MHTHTHTAMQSASRLSTTWMWHLSKAAADIGMLNSEVTQTGKVASTQDKQIAKLKDMASNLGRHVQPSARLACWDISNTSKATQNFACI